MDRLTRKELKTDKFAVEVGEALEYLERHRRQATIAGIAILVILVAAIGAHYYAKRQHSIRQAALREALTVFQAVVGDVPDNPYLPSFKTEEDKDAAVRKAFTEIIEKYPGSDEAVIATYYLGVAAVNRGDTAEAEKRFKEAAEADRQPYSSQAAYSLAQLYDRLGRSEEAQKIYRELMEHPTVLVSKEQATIALARSIGKTNPEEARKLLEPLRAGRGPVSRAALTALGELQQGSTP